MISNNLITTMANFAYMYYNTLLLHSLSNNEIGSEGATVLADALQVNQSLRKLKYVTAYIFPKTCMLSCQIIISTHLTSQLGMFTILYKFCHFHYSLYHTSLSDSGAIALANALQQNMSLEELK